MCARSMRSKIASKKTGSAGPAVGAARPARSIAVRELSRRQQEAFNTPSGFARLFLGMDLYQEQEHMLDAFGPSGAAVSIRTANEYGKTTRLIAPAILWHASVFPQEGPTGGCISTSGSWPQVTTQLVPALKRFAHKFPRWDFQATQINEGSTVKWLGFSTNDAGRAEGFHGTRECPLMAMVDEAKTVQDDIIKMIETRCRPQRMGLLSSAGYAELEFYRSQTVNAGLYRCFKVAAAARPSAGVETLRDHMLVKHLNYQVLDRIILKEGGGDWDRGLKSALVNSSIFAEFMEFVEGAVLSLSDVERCLGTPPAPRAGERHGRCDFAGGGDENCFALRVGNRVQIRDAWVDRDTLSAAGRFVKNFVQARDEFGLRADEIDGDADGMGAVMVRDIAALGWEIGAFHGGAPAAAAARYKNRVSEEWHEGAEQIRRCQVVLPDDAVLKVQLTNRKAKVDLMGKPPGRLWLESKDDLKRRGVASPDRADAALGCMAPLRARGSTSSERDNRTQSDNPWADDYAPAGAEMRVSEELLRGMDAG